MYLWNIPPPFIGSSSGWPAFAGKSGNWGSWQRRGGEAGWEGFVFSSNGPAWQTRPGVATGASAAVAAVASSGVRCAVGNAGVVPGQPAVRHRSGPAAPDELELRRRQRGCHAGAAAERPCLAVEWCPGGAIVECRRSERAGLCVDWMGAEARSDLRGHLPNSGWAEVATTAGHHGALSRLASVHGAAGVRGGRVPAAAQAARAARGMRGVWVRAAEVGGVSGVWGGARGQQREWGAARRRGCGAGWIGAGWRGRWLECREARISFCLPDLPGA